MEALGIRIKAPFNFADATPVDLGWISILLIASHNAAFAADALCHVKMKPVLLARLKRSLGNQRDWR